jgi:hypothetical protein
LISRIVRHALTVICRHDAPDNDGLRLGVDPCRN